mmetsp:Transcript_8176/g.10503  ORF Transcript_8176/g.10503 Transcript_8176/m.10503 type:complete len:403 (-) Transcript_8176:210-1418(-)
MPARKVSHSSLPPETVEYLKAWMMSPEHISHPYPTDAEKAAIMADTGIEIKQLTNWFVNNRKRFWKPRIEAAQKNGIPPHQLFAGVSTQRSIFPKSALLPFESNNDVSGTTSNCSDLNHTPQRGQTGSSSLGLGTVCTVSDSSHGTYSSDEASIDDDYHVSCGDNSRAHHATDISQEICSSNHDKHESMHTDENEVVTRHEIVDVHILRPFDGSIPAIKDMTILSKVQQSDRVLRSYLGCNISYSFSKKVAGNRKKVQSRRDAEVVRVKKFILRKYLSSLPEGSTNPSCEVNEVAKPSTPAIIPFSSLQISSFVSHSLSSEDDSTHTSSKSVKRPNIEQGVKVTEAWKQNVCDSPRREEPTKRKRIKLNADGWKKACMSASHGYCDSLPSLEEATEMFGYAR